MNARRHQEEKKTRVNSLDAAAVEIVSRSINVSGHFAVSPKIKCILRAAAAAAPFSLIKLILRCSLRFFFFGWRLCRQRHQVFALLPFVRFRALDMEIC